MRHSLVLAVVFGACMAVAFGGASAQTKTRAEVKADRDAFMATHEWDEQDAMWVPKPGTKDAKPKPPTETREQAKKERDAFLSKNRFDEVCGCYKPLQGTPRDVSTLTREQRKAETADFNRTHQFDEVTGTWVER